MSKEKALNETLQDVLGQIEMGFSPGAKEVLEKELKRVRKEIGLEKLLNQKEALGKKREYV